MFASIQDVYLFCNFQANSLYSGKISPDEFNIAIQVASQQYFRKKLGFTEDFTNKERQAPDEIQTSFSNDDTLMPFLKSVPVSISGAGFNKPADFAAQLPHDTLFVSRDNQGNNIVVTNPIKFVSIAEFGYRLSNYATPPTVEYPYATYKNGQLIVAPSTIAQINWTYYRYPATPLRAYTLNAQDQDVYDPLASIQIEFPNLDWENIAQRAIKFWAVFLREESLYQMTSIRVKEGE